MLAVALAAASLVYMTACIAATWRWRRARATPLTTRRSALPPVTILKPLCGMEPQLDENLRSFCTQPYPTVQLLFGARERDDPALDVARRLMDESPDRDIAVIVGARPLGANRKVETLANLLPSARHDVLVIADSDIRVGPTYLQHVIAPLMDPSVGLVTCLYRGMPTPSFWSRLGALAIDEWFLPSVLVSRALGSSAYCSGATMALRRDVLERLGGFEALAPWLADDHELGARVRHLGLRTVIAPYEVATTVHEPDAYSLVAHELRWMRTIRAAQPLGHACLFLTYAIPLTVLAALFAPLVPWLLALPLLAIALRVALHVVLQGHVQRDEWSVQAMGVNERSAQTARMNGRSSIWLIPLRDLLSFGIWIASFTSRAVVWRQLVMRVRTDGVLLGDEGRFGRSL
ncbi:MAG TPA: bacteriohopanetetrol glucosamine biosynthesis glycosyltransferase HpnI [Gemmatimonadaceae bacterium]